MLGQKAGVAGWFTSVNLTMVEYMRSRPQYEVMRVVTNHCTYQRVPLKALLLQEESSQTPQNAHASREFRLLQVH